MTRLEEKPQLSGSLVTPAMHEPDNEFAGSAQLVKSARIWLIAFEFALPQMSLAVMDCSLSAYSAYDQCQQPQIRLQHGDNIHKCWHTTVEWHLQIGHKAKSSFEQWHCRGRWRCSGRSSWTSLTGRSWSSRSSRKTFVG